MCNKVKKHNLLIIRLHTNLSRVNAKVNHPHPVMWPVHVSLLNSLNSIFISYLKHLIKQNICIELISFNLQKHLLKCEDSAGPV